MSALLELESARIDQSGVPLIEGLSLSATGARVGLVGDWSGLFALLGGHAQLSAGRVTLSGHDADKAVAAGVVGLARRDSPLPEAWNLDHYWVEGARLGGLGKRAAEDSVRALFASLEVPHLAGRRIGTLTPAEKRIAALGLGLLDKPAVLAVEDPISELDDASAARLCRIVERAADGRALVLSSRALPGSGPEHALFAAAEQVFVLEAGTLVGQGTLASLTAPGSRYVVSVTRHGRELSERLSAAGLEVALSQTETGEGSRLFVSLAESGSTEPIVEAALAVQAPIVELLPVSRSGEAPA